MGKLLELLAVKQTDWIKMALSIQKTNPNLGMEDARELVQEMYIKLSKFEDDHQHLMYNDDEVNTMYVYLTLKNLFVDKMRYRKKYPHVITDEQLYDIDTTPLDEIDHEASIAQMKLEDDIKNEVESWTHYDKTVFNIIYMEGTSMRKLSRVTKISLPSIFNTCKAKKQILRDKFQEQYDELKKYNNNDN